MKDLLTLARRFSPRATAILEALFVTFIWSTSWVLIKIGLKDIPALTFAGLRYGLAFLCVLPLVVADPRHRARVRGLSRRSWSRLILLGLLFYAITQGAVFLGLMTLPAVTVSLLFNLTTIAVALLGIGWLQERPSALQWVGVAVSIGGVLLYFYPILLPAGQTVGLLAVSVGVLTNAVSAVLSRSINRAGELPPLVVTVVSLGVGAFVLVIAGWAFQGVPHLQLKDWLIIAWLAVVNTALAFTLWNHTLRTLAAVESSIINNTMLIQIAILAWVFLGERITLQQGIGMILAGLGALIVQLRGSRGAVEGIVETPRL